MRVKDLLHPTYHLTGSDFDVIIPEEFVNDLDIIDRHYYQLGKLHVCIVNNFKDENDVKKYLLMREASSDKNRKN